MTSLGYVETGDPDLNWAVHGIVSLRLIGGHLVLVEGNEVVDHLLDIGTTGQYGISIGRYS